MDRKPWAVFITWPKIPTPVKSAEYSNRISAEMSKQWLEKKLLGYLKIEIVWILEDCQPPASLRRAPSESARHSRLSSVQMRRIER